MVDIIRMFYRYLQEHVLGRLICSKITNYYYLFTGKRRILIWGGKGNPGGGGVETNAQSTNFKIYFIIEET